MRLVGIELSGFRAFPREVAFDLDADAVIVIAANGQGKTSLFDGVLWGLTGCVPRLGSGEDVREAMVSLYSPTGEARVSLELRTDDGDPCRIVRSYDRSREELRIECRGELQLNHEAESWLVGEFWPQASSAPEPMLALVEAVTRCVYLQQDVVSRFIGADDDNDRFMALSELVGAGRVSELQHQLERDRQVWSRATNALEADVTAARELLMETQTRSVALAQSSDEVIEGVRAEWQRWWTEAWRLGIEDVDVPGIDSASAQSRLDRSMTELELLRRRNIHRQERVTFLLSEFRARSAQTIADTGPLRARLASREREVGQAQAILAAAQAEAVREREAQARSRERQEELRALARLALRHLGERCPICSQEYDQPETRRRLEQLAVPTDDTPAAAPTSDEVGRYAADVQRLENARSATEAELRSAEAAEQAEKSWLEAVSQRLSDLDLVPDSITDVPGALGTCLNQLDDADGRLSQLRADGEQLALALTRTVESARRAELQERLPLLKSRLGDLDREWRHRTRTTSVAAEIIEGLREAAFEVVSADLEQIEPLVQRVYSAIDPHPTFRVVRLLARYWHGRGRLQAKLNDPVGGISTDAPPMVLSSSQVNALAVSVFLAFGLSVTKPPLSVTMLDDPLQSLDYVNLLGLIDLLRRAKGRRQLMLSTHDARFGQLLERKLRPIDESQRTLIIELDGWDRHGPTVQTRDVVPDSQSLRVVA